MKKLKLFMNATTAASTLMIMPLISTKCSNEEEYNFAFNKSKIKLYDKFLIDGEQNDIPENTYAIIWPNKQQLKEEVEKIKEYVNTSNDQTIKDKFYFANNLKPDLSFFNPEFLYARKLLKFKTNIKKELGIKVDFHNIYDFYDKKTKFDFKYESLKGEIYIKEELMDTSFCKSPGKGHVHINVKSVLTDDLSITLVFNL